MRLTAYIDYGSPYSYLAWHRVTRGQVPIDSDHIVWRPVSAGHIFKAEGGRPNMSYPNQGPYHLEDVRRWARALDIPYRQPSVYPQRTLEAMRIHHALEQEDGHLALEWAEQCFRAHWTEDARLDEGESLRRIAHLIGLDPARTVAHADESAAKAALAGATEEAIAAGAPGVPFFVVDRNGARSVYWGNDRLDWAAAALEGKDSPFPRAP